MNITGAAIWINPGVGVLTIIALWPVAIMFMHVRDTLRSLKIIPKYAMYQVNLRTFPIKDLTIFCSVFDDFCTRLSSFEYKTVSSTRSCLTPLNKVVFQFLYFPVFSIQMHLKKKLLRICFNENTEYLSRKFSNAAQIKIK